MSVMQAMREGIKAATDDLRKKSISLAQSHYGSLSYILAYAASGFNCDIHLMITDGEVRPSDLHCVCPLIVQAFCQAELNLWLWHWYHEHSLARYASHVLLGATNQRYLCSCTLEQQWAHCAASFKPIFVAVKAASQQSVCTRLLAV